MNAAAVTLPQNDDREDSTLAGLVEVLEARDAEALPDRTVPLSKVRMTGGGTLILPSVQGTYAMTEWARGQLARSLGVNWEKWTANARATDIAEEMNRRFARASETMKLRSVSRVPEGIEATGTIIAMVGPDYSPVPDGVIGHVLHAALAAINEDTKIVRYDATELTTSYAVRVGEPKQTANLKTLVEGFVLEHGGRVNADTLASNWVLPTKYGDFLVSVHDSESSISTGYLTVFGRFVEPERARILGCNPYTGKLNYHAGNVAEGATAERTFEAWKSMIARALLPSSSVSAGRHEEGATHLLARRGRP